MIDDRFIFKASSQKGLSILIPPHFNYDTILKNFVIYNNIYWDEKDTLIF